MQQNCTLETLNLAMNGLHVEGTRFLMASLKGNEGLRELDLSANRIDKEAAKVVARTVPHMLQLTTLRVRVDFPVFPDLTQQLTTLKVMVELQAFPDFTLCTADDTESKDGITRLPSPYVAADDTESKGGISRLS